MKIQLLVTRRDGSTELLELSLPITFSGHDDDFLKMWEIHDAAGTDYFFNKNDGTYDGWGRGVACDEEAAALLDHAHSTKAPPKIEVQ